MGQYWLPVNLDKKEFVNPHKLGSGLKLWEQLANPGVGQALVILMAAMPEARGGGDLAHDPIIGRWSGDRIALVGDYAEDDDLANSPVPASVLFALCDTPEGWNKTLVYWLKDEPEKWEKYHHLSAFTDVTDQVCRVIEREMDGKFVGDGWRDFVQNPQ